ncbi:MAG TPA: hypothetical protein VNA04_06340 [Thermoanaerobaculia bacterium]|nr:hypothetical protein [Thermoanaerobaculia bacterium]
MLDLFADTGPRGRILLLAVCLGLAGSPGVAGESLLDAAWPGRAGAALHEIGWEIGVVFSPDLSVPGTCDFYAALGFACFQETDWGEVIDGIGRFNSLHPERAIRTVVLETHGTNGHGLKLQRSPAPRAARSYTSIGGLRERLAPLGVRYVILGACNSRRLLRPEIHRHLDPRPREKLFLPPTQGIYGASPSYDPDAVLVDVLTPGSSQVEMTVVGSVAELSSHTRLNIETRVGPAASDLRFVVSDLMMRMIARDPALELERGEPAISFSGRRSSAAESERLYSLLVAALDAAARAAETRVAQTISQ